MRLSYYLRPSNSKKVGLRGLEHIYFFIRHKKNEFTIPTGFRIERKYWDAERQRVKVSHPNAVYLNSFLERFRQEIEALIMQIKAENPLADFTLIRRRLLEEIKRREKDFFEVLDEFISVKRKDWASATVKKYKTLHNLLKEFSTQYNTTVMFSNLNQRFFENFYAFLLQEKKYLNNSIEKVFTLLGTFLRWSAEHGYCEDVPKPKINAKKYDIDIVYLTDDELNRLMDLSLSGTLEKVRDVFLFGCYTGARFSDIKNLRAEHIKGDEWHLVTKKTKDILRIPLNANAKKILNKYFSQGKSLPVISNQKTNEYIKYICSLAGINEPVPTVHFRGSERIEVTRPKSELVSTHTARRTFVTLSLEKGMRPEVVMAITGHKDYKTFRKYLKITSDVAKKELKLAWDLKVKISEN